MSLVVVCTGPRSNATRLLSRILDTADKYGPGGIHPIHFPCYPPEQIDFAAEFPRALFVVIWRQDEPAAHSMVAAGYHEGLDDAGREQRETRAFLGGQIAQLQYRACLVFYEDLIERPDATVGHIDTFLRFHGYTGVPLTHEPIRDENAKWLGK